MQDQDHQPLDQEMENLLGQITPPVMDARLSSRMEHMMEEEFRMHAARRNRRRLIACAAVITAALLCLPLIRMQEKPQGVPYSTTTRLVSAVPAGIVPEGHAYRATYETTVSVRTRPEITISVSVPEERNIIVTNDAI